MEVKIILDDEQITFEEICEGYLEELDAVQKCGTKPMKFFQNLAYLEEIGMIKIEINK